MKKYSEHQIIAVLVVVFGVIVGGLLLTAQRYSFGTQSSVIEQCQAYLQAVVQPNTLSLLMVMTVLALLVVFIVSLLVSFVKTQRTYQKIQSKVTPLPEKLSKLLRTIGIYRSEIWFLPVATSVAVTAGIFSPKIIISEGLLKKLSANELRAVLLHEKYHLRNHHGLLHVLAGSVLQSLSIFFPIFFDARKILFHYFETVADNYAATTQGSYEYVHSALYKLRGTSSSSFSGLGFATVLENRITQMERAPISFKSYNSGRLILSALSVSLWMCVVFLSPDRARSYSPEKLLSECSGYQCSSECKAVLEKEVQSRAMVGSPVSLPTLTLP